MPPYGQDAAPTLQSIFDLKHLQAQAFFLDTQCMICAKFLKPYILISIADRMPMELGSFISKSVYASALKSEHNITSSSCVKLVDVCNGYEENQGLSWKVSLLCTGQYIMYNI